MSNLLRPPKELYSCVFYAALELAQYQFGITDLNGAIFDEWSCGQGIRAIDIPRVLNEAFWPVACVDSFIVNGWSDRDSRSDYFKDKIMYSKKGTLPAIILLKDVESKICHAIFVKPGDKIPEKSVSCVITMDYI